MVFYKVWWKSLFISALRTSRLSPIASGGLEILLMAKLTISDEKRRYLAHLKTPIERVYQVAGKEKDDLHGQEEDICDDNEDDTIILEDDEHDIQNN